MHHLHGRFVMMRFRRPLFINQKRMKAFRKKCGKGCAGIPATIVLFAGILLFACSGNVSAQSTLNVIKVKRAKDCHRFFQYAGKDIPIISGFLEGRVEGEKYCLILHLTNIELKGI
jgi:hypothetical protein